MLQSFKNRISSLRKAPGTSVEAAQTSPDEAVAPPHEDEVHPTFAEANDLLLASPLNHPLLIEQALGLVESAGNASGIAGSNHELRLSWFFDPGFYLDTNPDVAEAGLHPYLHFLISGLAEGRSPHPLVDLGYLATTVARADGPWTAAELADALRSDEASPHPLFDTAYYLKCNPDVRDAGWQAFEHYLAHGAEEGRSPNPDFIADWYLEQDPALPRGRLAAFVHFVRHGAREGRLPGASVVAAAAPETEVEQIAHAPRSTRPVEGRLDDVHGLFASGWAWAPGHPDEPIVIELLAEGRIVGLGTADHFRADLQQGGLGDGHHAFLIPLSRSLQDGHVHVLKARVAGQPEQALAGARRVQFPLADQDVLDAIPLQRAIDAMFAAGCDERFVDRASRAFMEMEAGDFAAGSEAIEALAAERGDCGIVIAKLAETRLFAGDAEAALPLYEHARQLGGVPAEWLCLGKGTALRRVGWNEEAAAQYREGLRLVPDHPRLLIRSQELAIRERLLECSKLLADNRPERALAALGDLLLHAPGNGAVQSLALQANRVLTGLHVEGLDASVVDAHRELDLLEAVLQQLDQRGGVR